jgi:hypothetical protein
MTAKFILKHFPTLLLIRVVIFGLTVPKLCQVLLLNRSCARIQQHFIGLAVHFLQSLSLHLQFHLRILLEDLAVTPSLELRNPLVGDTACTELHGVLENGLELFLRLAFPELHYDPGGKFHRFEGKRDYRSVKNRDNRTFSSPVNSWRRIDRSVKK